MSNLSRFSADFASFYATAAMPGALPRCSPNTRCPSFTTMASPSRRVTPRITTSLGPNRTRRNIHSSRSCCGAVIGRHGLVPGQQLPRQLPNHAGFPGRQIVTFRRIMIEVVKLRPGTIELARSDGTRSIAAKTDCRLTVPTFSLAIRPGPKTTRGVTPGLAR
jgi:hypothetical protein